MVIFVFIIATLHNYVLWANECSHIVDMAIGVIIKCQAKRQPNDLLLAQLAAQPF